MDLDKQGSGKGLWDSMKVSAIARLEYSGKIIDNHLETSLKIIKSEETSSW